MYSVVVNQAHIVKGQPQKKGISPDIVQHHKLKYVKVVSCVDHLSFVQNVANVPTVALDLPIGARLYQF